MMAVRIEIPNLNIKAIIEDGQWTCDNALFVALLEATSELNKRHYYDPDPDFTMANAVINEFGGQIIYHEEMPHDSDVDY